MTDHDKSLQALVERTSKLSSDELLTLYIALISQSDTEEKTKQLKKAFKTMIFRALKKEGFQ